MILTSYNLCYAQQDFSEEQLAKGIEAYQCMDFEKAISYLSPIEDILVDADDENRTILSFILGTCYHQSGNLEKALSLYEIVLQSSNDIAITQIRPILLSIYTDLGNERVANEYLTKMLDMMNDSNFKQSGFYSDYAIDISAYYITKMQYEKAIEFAQKGISIIDSELKNENLKGLQKNTFYMTLGVANRELQNYNQAVLDFKNALKYISYTPNVDKSEALHFIGVCYEYANLPDSAIIYLKEAEKLYKSRNHHLERSEVMNNLELGVIYSLRGECIKAKQYLIDAENGFKQLGELSLLPYIYAHLYNNFKEIGDKGETDKYARLIKDFIKYAKNDNSREYYICYSTYASILESEGKYNDAISIIINLINIENRNKETPANNLALLYYKLALCNAKTGDLVQAENNIRTSLNLMDSIKDLYKDQYIEEHILLAEILSKTGRIGEAIKNLENIQSFVTISCGYEDETSNYYCYLSSLYAEIGNYKDLLKNNLLDSEIQLKNKGNTSYAYAISLINLNEAYRLNQESEKAKECLDTASQIIKNLFGEESKEFHNVFHKQVVKYTFDTSKVIEGDKAFKKCLHLSEKCFGANSIQYGVDLCWYAMFKFYSMQDEQSIELMQKGIELLSRFEKYEKDYLFYLSQLSTMCFIFKNYELAYSYNKQYYTRTKKFLTTNLPNLIDWQREALWTPIQENISHSIAAATETNSSLFLKLAYNLTLLEKGLLLHCSNNITNAIKQSKNIELQEIHKQIQQEKDKLLNTLEQNKIDAIRNRIDSLLRVELNKVIEFDILEGLVDIEWTDVCDNLKEGDVAIEFVSYPTQDCISYAALVLNSNSTAPQCIPLFNDKELRKYHLDDNIEYDYLNSDLYKVIWNKLETYALKDAKNIYFAPCGVLHKIAIESLIDKRGQYASEKWNLHRLTSTRQLVLTSPKTEYRSAVLYGGLTYSMGIKELEEAAILRSGVNYLTETKTEVSEIKELLEKRSIDCKLKTGEKGTEESFFSLSSTNINILHLATHGFFWTKDNESNYTNVKFSLLLHNSSTFESALLRSGLLLSGANIALREKEISKGIKDGILTAHEISSLDFEGLDLVVLSACQTALGEISGEGVYGLQRGFKLAGAQSILMSLWKIDDTATKLLMIEFYKNYLSGETKTKSLLKAQKAVRNFKGFINGEKRNFSNPKYWAGFIMLDGIEPEK